jgi:hypothetical protein
VTHPTSRRARFIISRIFLTKESPVYTHDKPPITYLQTEDTHLEREQ